MCRGAFECVRRRVCQIAHRADTRTREIRPEVFRHRGQVWQCHIGDIPDDQRCAKCLIECRGFADAIPERTGFVFSYSIGNSLDRTKGMIAGKYIERVFYRRTTVQLRRTVTLQKM